MDFLLSDNGKFLREPLIAEIVDSLDNLGLTTATIVSVMSNNILPLPTEKPDREKMEQLLKLITIFIDIIRTAILKNANNTNNNKGRITAALSSNPIGVEVINTLPGLKILLIVLDKLVDTTGTGRTGRNPNFDDRNPNSESGVGMGLLDAKAQSLLVGGSVLIQQILGTSHVYVVYMVLFFLLHILVLIVYISYYMLSTVYLPLLYICVHLYIVQLVERSASRTVKSVLSRDAIKSLLPSLARLLDFTPPAIPVP